MEFQDGMIIKDSKGTLWFLEKSSPGQYGIGRDWKAPKVTMKGEEFILSKSEYLHVDSVESTRSNPNGLEFFTFAKPRYFLDNARTEKFVEHLRSAAVSSVRGKLTKTELKILVEDLKKNGEI